MATSKVEGNEVVEEECWGLPDDFNIHATHQVKTVYYPQNHSKNNDNVDTNNSHSFQIECIEPDSPLDINNKSQSSSEYDATGHCVWTGAFLLIQCIHELEDWIENNTRDSQPPKRMIEFGTGTGIGGLAMILADSSNNLTTSSTTTITTTSVSPSYICFTDNDPAALKVCERNCKLNNLCKTQYEIKELTWGEEYNIDKDGTYDIALATDVLYDVDLIKPLFTTVSQCLPSDGIFILSHIPRACYNENNPPEAQENLEQYIIDQAVKYNLHLETIIRPPKEGNFDQTILDWCAESAFLGGGILIFRRK